MAAVREAARRALTEAGTLVVGQERSLELLLVALLVAGHVLLEDVRPVITGDALRGLQAEGFIGPGAADWVMWGSGDRACVAGGVA